MLCLWILTSQLTCYVLATSICCFIFLLSEVIDEEEQIRVSYDVISSLRHAKAATADSDFSVNSSTESFTGNR